MRRQLAILSGLTASATLLVACGGTASQRGESLQENSEPVNGGEIVVASLPATIDPYSTTSRSNWMVAASVCEGLFANAANTEVKEGLVESYDYDSETGVYTFKLRDNVPFHSGSILTSKDVVASLERYSDGDAGEIFRGLVDSVTAVDDLTFEIQTTSPTGALPALLATPDTGAYIQSASFLADNEGEDMNGLDCTGPYKLENFTVDAQAVVSRFDGYASRTESSDGAAGEKIAYADTIKFVPLNEDNVVNQLRAGQVHIAPQFVSIDQLPVYEADNSLSPVVSEGAGFKLIQFNNRKGLFTDVRMRNAVLNAVDPEAIAIQQSGSLDTFSDISSFFPESSPWYSENGAAVWEGRDPELSKRLLEEAGYDGSPVRVLYRPSSDGYGPLLKQQLEAVGFNVNLMPADAATFGATRKDDNEWDIFLAGGTAYSDPLTVVFLNDDFPGWWASDKKKELMSKLIAGASFEERKPIWDEMQDLIWEEVPFVKLGHDARLVLANSKVRGLEPNLGTARGFYNVSLSNS